MKRFVDSNPTVFIHETINTVGRHQMLSQSGEKWLSALSVPSPARWVLLASLINCVGLGLTIPFLFPYLTVAHSYSPSFVALLVSLISALAFVVGVASGPIIDRLGPVMVLIPSFAVACAGLWTIAFVQSKAIAVVAVALFGIGGAALPSGFNTLYTLVSEGEEERRRIFGLGFAVVNLGAGLGGLIGGTLVGDGSLINYRRLYVLDGTTSLAAMMILLALSPRFSMTRIACGKGAVDVLVQPDSRIRPKYRAGYLHVLQNRSFRRFLLVVLLLQSAAYVQFQFGFVAFAVTEGGVTPRVLSMAFALNCIIVVALQVPMNERLKHIDGTWILSIAALILAASWTRLGVTGVVGTLGGVVVIAGVMVFVALFSVAETMIAPLIPAIANRLAEDNLRGRYNASLQATTVFAATVVPVVDGPLIGAGQGRWWVAGIAILALLAARVIARSRLD